MTRFLAIGLLALSWTGALAREPLKTPEVPEFYQRVLTLPGAKLSPGPGEDATGADLPIFSVLYVYDRKQDGGKTWLEVGSKAAGSGDGWLPAEGTQDWRSMLVMQYAPRSIRSRVLVFNEREKLEVLVTDPQGPGRAKQLVSQLATPSAESSGLIAAEPAEPVDYSKRPYVMPILDWKSVRFTGDKPGLLIDLASVTSGAPSAPDPVPSPLLGAGDAGDTKDMKIAVVFLLETNKSMQPFLDRVRDAAIKLHNDLAKDGTLNRVSFGIVAYRGTLAHDPRVEYTTRIFQTLDPAANPDEILRVLPQVKEAVAETPGWDEDAFAGMYDAMTQLDWRPYAARFLIQVSDSGALPGKSQFAKYHDVDLDNIIELASRKGVAIFPLYLLTPQGNQFPASRRRALYQYKVLGSQTGDPAVSKFVSIPGGSTEAFGAAMTEFGNTIRAALSSAQPPQPVPMPCCAGPAAPSGPSAPAAPASAVAQAVMNEIFRTQLEFIGSKAGLKAPTFVKGWVADHDLTDPNIRSLDVKVFLTRNQLNGLAQSLARVVDAAKQADLSQDTFFDLLRSLSATMAGDPNRQVPGTFNNLEESNLLPAYLSVLPYRSKVLRMSRDTWVNAGMTGQQLWIDELEYKLKQYQDMYQDTRAWIDFGSHDPGEAVYPVPLDTLP